MSRMLFLAAVLSCLQLSSGVCTDLPIRLPGKVVLPSSAATCPSDAERQSIIDELDTDLDQIIQSQLQLFKSLTFPVECPGQGWVKVADFNLETNSTEPCPGTWEKRNISGISNCRLPQTTVQCQSATFPTNSLSYSQVCGRIKGYQYGRTSAFFPSISETSIDEAYLDGVFIARGNPRQHVWSFAAGYSSSEGVSGFRCPCAVAGATNPPDFVGSNSYCDSGTDDIPISGVFYDHNPLWDAEGCVGENQCCLRGPYFFADLAENTCDPLEVRLCLYDPLMVNIGVSIVELYVK